MTDICVGMLAYSKCGRDRKRLFCVVGTLEDEFVLIADGNLRRLDKPKIKRLKHLSFIPDVKIELPSSDKELFKLINEFENSSDRRNYSAKR
ncbi:MAG: KOW domain-containing RNA-binding protein [Clostridia bacterium]|nr:KOW domain-containing RNA-binding protein [Clostridia bacterium]